MKTEKNTENGNKMEKYFTTEITLLCLEEGFFTTEVREPPTKNTGEQLVHPAPQFFFCNLQLKVTLQTKVTINTKNT